MHSSRPSLLCTLALTGLALPALAQPANNGCAQATPLTPGTPAIGTLAGATPDGACNCAGDGAAPDAFHLLTTGPAGVYTLGLCAGTSWDSVLSIHSGCPATAANEIACDDDGCRAPGDTDFGYPSRLRACLPATTQFLVRVAAYRPDTILGSGAYALSVAAPLPRTGACCAGAGCSILTQAACASAGGTYSGDLSSCTLAAGTPTTFTETAGSSPIPDAGTLVRTITVGQAQTVGDARLTLNLSHGFVGDLTITLSHAGSSVTLMRRVGLGSLGSDATLAGAYTFADTAPTSVWDFAPTPASGHPVPAGAYLCSDENASALSLCQAFAGHVAAGDWTLTIADASVGYTGTLHSWSLTLDGAGSAACCRANFNGVNGLEVQDIFAFLNAWMAAAPSADFNASGSLETQDIFDFLNAWWAGC